MQTEVGINASKMQFNYILTFNLTDNLSGDASNFRQVTIAVASFKFGAIAIQVERMMLDFKF